MKLSDWQNVIVSWVNALKLTEYPIDDVLDLLNRDFFVNLISQLDSTRTVKPGQDVISFVEEFLSDEYPGWRSVDVWGREETCLLSSLLLGRASVEGGRDLQSGLYSLNTSTQCFIQAFLESLIAIPPSSLTISILHQSILTIDYEEFEGELGEVSSPRVYMTPSKSNKTFSQSPALGVVRLGGSHSQSEVRSLKNSLGLLTCENFHLQEELEQARKELEKHKEELKKKEQETLRLSNELFVRESEVSGSGGGRSRRERRRSNGLAERQRLREKVEALESTNQGLLQEIDHLMHNSNQLNNKVCQHEKEVLKWQQNAEERENRLEEYKGRIRQLELEVSTLQETCKEQMEILNERVECKLDESGMNLGAEMSQETLTPVVELQLTALQQQFDAQAAELVRLKEENEKILVLENEVRARDSEIESKNHTIEELEKRLIFKQNEMSEYEKEALKWRRNAEEGESKLETLKDTVRQLELEVSTLQEAYKEAVLVKEEELNARTLTLEDELSTKAVEIVTRDSRILKLENKNKDLSFEIEELRKESAEKEQNLDTQEKLINNFKNTIEELNETLLNLKNKYEERKYKMMEYQKESHEWHRKTEEWRSKAEEYADNVKQWVHEAQRQRETYEVAEFARVKEETEKTEKILALKDELLIKDVEINNKNYSIHELEMALTQEESKVRVHKKNALMWERSAEEAESKLEELKVNMRQLELQVSTLEQSHKEIELAKEKVHEKIAILESELSARDVDINYKNSQIDKLEWKSTDLTAEIEELQKNYVEKEQSLNRKESLIDHFKTTIEELNEELSILKRRSETDQNEAKQYEIEALKWRRNAEDAESKLEKFKETVRQLQLEVTTLEETNKVTESARQKDYTRILTLENELSTKNVEIENKNFTILELENKTKDLSFVIKDLQRNSAEKEEKLDNQEKLLSNYKDSINELNMALSHLNSRCEADQNEVILQKEDALMWRRNAEDAENKFLNLKERVSELEHEVSTLLQANKEEELARLKKGTTRILILEEELSTREVEIVKKNSIIQDLDSKCKDLISEIEELKQNSAEREQIFNSQERLIINFKEAVTELNKLFSNLEVTSEVEQNEVSNDLSEGKCQNDELMLLKCRIKEMAEIKGEVERLQESMELGKNQIEMLQHEKKILEKKIVILTSEVEEIESFKGEINELENKLKEVKKELKEEQEKVAIMSGHVTDEEKLKQNFDIKLVEMESKMQCVLDDELKKILAEYSGKVQQYKEKGMTPSKRSSSLQHIRSVGTDIGVDNLGCDEEIVNEEAGKTTNRRSVRLPHPSQHRPWYSILSGKVFPTAEEEEEDEVFDEGCLSDLKAGITRLPRTTRASLPLPTSKEVLPNDSPDLGSINEKPKKKKIQISYKKPGPPTPCRNSGRPSLQSLERGGLPLNENVANCPPLSPTKKIKNFFMGKNKQPKNEVESPTKKRLSFFQKKFGGRENAPPM